VETCGGDQVSFPSLGKICTNECHQNGFIATPQVTHQVKLITEELHKFAAGSAQTLPSTYMRMSHFSPNMNSFLVVL